MRILLDDLILIGTKLGVSIAERVYLSLRDEPRDAQGHRIDWKDIREKITATHWTGNMP
jgi:hypothetical protein